MTHFFGKNVNKVNVCQFNFLAQRILKKNNQGSLSYVVSLFRGTNMLLKWWLLCNKNDKSFK